MFMGRNYVKKQPVYNPPATAISLASFGGVSKFKSIRRAITRGHVSAFGTVYPRRPFNNRKNRPLEDEKRKVYEQFKKYNKVG